MNRVTIQIAREELVLLAGKGLYWPSISTLIISDLHLGKSSHFRKSGIPLSMGSDQEDMERINEMIGKLLPTKLIFLGDLFHSDHNIEWDLFKNWIKQYPHIEFILVEGNHDLLSANIYESAGIALTQALTINKIHFTHEPVDGCKAYNICGHIHPGIRLVGKAKQAIRISCFYIGKERMVLPAFGSLTGLCMIEPKPEETVYGIANLSLIKLGSVGHTVIKG